MKRGFSFVEMSIVLVIIGLIMAMALKGKELVTSSEIRKELNKFRKYEAAFTGTLMKTNKPLPKELPDSAAGLVVWSDNITDKFIEQNYLKLEDKYTRYNTNTADSKIVEFYPDVGVANGMYVIDPADYPRWGETFSVYFDNVSDVFVCLLENMIDDKDVDNATGRSVNTTGNNFSVAEYSDCTSLSASDKRRYAYMFFKH
ncbi:MAG: type II secretion system GspH family protein [Deferribacteraceae bacterium]|nr:type II secretion system GspH family protein [Deferribacteraceae bacterium]